MKFSRANGPAGKVRDRRKLIDSNTSSSLGLPANLKNVGNIDILLN